MQHRGRGGKKRSEGTMLLLKAPASQRPCVSLCCYPLTAPVEPDETKARSSNSKEIQFASFANKVWSINYSNGVKGSFRAGNWQSPEGWAQPWQTDSAVPAACLSDTFLRAERKIINTCGMCPKSAHYTQKWEADKRPGNFSGSSS